MLKQGKKNTDVLFVDASKEFLKDKAKNKLTVDNVKKIVDTYLSYASGDHVKAEIEKFSHIATLDEIKQNDFNLNIPRYVDTFEEEVIIDIDEVNKEIEDLKRQIKDSEDKMAKYLKELGLS